MVKRFLALLFLILTLGLIFPGHVKAQAPDSTEVELMKNRIRELILTDYPGPDSVQKLLNRMNADGSWQGIDYNSIEVEPWPPMAHFSYLMALVKAFENRRSSLYHDEGLGKSIHQSLDFWLNHNFVNKNWWEAEIGIPLSLCNIFIAMDKEISYVEFLKGLNLMRGSFITQTGQNMVWRAGIQIKIGLISFGRGRNNLIGAPQLQRLVRKTSDVLLMEPGDLIRLASDTLKSNLAVNPNEGIQSDNSFHQHGIQLQLGNYGTDYATSHAEWVYILKGTIYQYPESKVSVLRNYVLNGLSRVTWKGHMDISGLGRHIVYPGQQNNRGSAVIRLLGIMEKADPAHESDYQQTISFNKNAGTQPSFLSGNTYYWRSAMSVNRSDKSYISTRMCSKEIQSTESGWGVNVLGAHLADGATYIFQDGKEYENIFPVWDWHRIPGVTAYSNKTLPEIKWEGLHNESDFVGGVSDTLNGIAVMLFKRDNLEARKGWFYGPSGVVCLGAGVNSNEDFNVLTSVNQSLLKSSISLRAGRTVRKLTSGQHATGDNIKWVSQNGIGYIFLDKEKVYVGGDRQQGNWHRIHINGKTENVQKDIFNLWVDHGNRPQNGSYSFMIASTGDSKELDRMASKPSVKVLKNTSDVQAVYFKESGLTQIIFYRPESIKNEGLKVSSNAACLAMIRNLNDGQLKISVSVPPQFPGQIDLTLNGQFEGENGNYNAALKQTTITFNLPDGAFAGQTTSVIVNKL